MDSSDARGQSAGAEAVLLLEPNAAARSSITEAAEELGVPVEACRSVAACASRLEQVGDALRDPVALVASSEEAVQGRPALLDAVQDRVFTPPVVLTTAPSLSEADALALRRCAWELIPKPTDAVVVRQVLARAIGEGRRRVDDRRAVLEFRRREQSLSPEEMEVLQAICDGKLNKQIARELGVSVRTVEQRRRRVFTKMAVPSAVPLAMQLAKVRTLERVHAPRSGAASPANLAGAKPPAAYAPL